MPRLERFGLKFVGLGAIALLSCILVGSPLLTATLPGFAPTSMRVSPWTSLPSSTLEAAAAVVARKADDSTLIVAWSGDLNSMDPPDSLIEWNREVVLNVYETLVQYKFEKKADDTLVWQGLQVAPGLAERWTVSGPSVTFELRKGVKFYPSGNELTAEDVKYSLTRMTNVPGFGRFNANLAGLFDGEKQIQVVDRYTVKITFGDAKGAPMLFPSSLPSLRFPQFSVLDSAVVKSRATPDDLWATRFLKDHAVGTGPYYVADNRTPGQETTLQMVPNYWGKKPAFRRVILRVIKDSADVVALMRRGEVDVTTALGTRELTSLEQAGFKVRRAAVPNIVKLEIALDKPPLDIRNARKALAYAMPYDELAKNVYGGRAERALSYVNPDAPGFAPTFKLYNDINKAKELMQRANLQSGFQVSIFYDSGVPAFEDIALLIQDHLRKLNIVVDLKPLPTTQMGAERTARIRGQNSLQGLILSQGVIWLDDPDPNTDVWIKSDGVSNVTRYKNPVIDELHLAFRFSQDTKARVRAYEKIQGMVAEDVPMIPLLVTGRNAATHPRISGVSFTADPHNRFWTMFLAK